MRKHLCQFGRGAALSITESHTPEKNHHQLKNGNYLPAVSLYGGASRYPDPYFQITMSKHSKRAYPGTEIEIQNRIQAIRNPIKKHNVPTAINSRGLRTYLVRTTFLAVLEGA